MHPAGADRPQASPAELERRLTELESGHGCGADFDAASMVWLLALGLVLPLILLIIGWRL